MGYRCIWAVDMDVLDRADLGVRAGQSWGGWRVGAASVEKKEHFENKRTYRYFIVKINEIQHKYFNVLKLKNKLKQRFRY